VGKMVLFSMGKGVSNSQNAGIFMQKKRNEGKCGKEKIYQTDNSQPIPIQHPSMVRIFISCPQMEKCGLYWYWPW
jgi:hypothetical protein